MVKLFTDEEMDEMCKDYRSVPLELRSQVFSIDNEDPQLPIGYVAPVNINQYSLSLHKYYGLDSMAYVEEYNKLYDKNSPNIDIDKDIEEIQSEFRGRRIRRRNIEIEEAKLMGKEDERTQQPRRRGRPKKQKDTQEKEVEDVSPEEDK